MEEEGFAIYSKVKSRTPGYYPTEFPEFEDIDINDIEVNDMMTIRAFFKIANGKQYRIDGGLIDIAIEAKEGDILWGNILTELPKSFPLQKGTTIELSIDELLHFADRVK
jgi:hypothetical protein